MIAIISSFVPRVEAQDDSTETEKDTSKLKVKGVLEFGASWHFGCKLGAGIRLSGLSSIPPIVLKACFTYPNTSIGLSAMTYPIKKVKGVGFGFDVIDRYECNWSLYSEFYYGGLGQNTFGSPDTYWRIKDFIFSPAIELSTRIGGRCKLSLKSNLFFIFWSYSDGSWSRWKRYWNEEITFEVLLGH